MNGLSPRLKYHPYLMHTYPEYVQRMFGPTYRRIEAVLERLSRHKVLEIGEAAEIAKRMAYRYSGNPGATLKSVCCGVLASSHYKLRGYGHFYRGQVTNPSPFSFHLYKAHGPYSLIKNREVYSRDHEEMQCAVIGATRSYFVPIDYSALSERRDNFVYVFNCELCGRFGSPSLIHHRSGIYGWDAPRRLDGSIPRGYYLSKTCLCMGCWNRARAVMRRIKAADELRQMTGVLKKEAKKWRQSKQQMN